MLADTGDSGLGMSDLAGADAMSAIAEALIASQVQLDQRALAEVIFIRVYAGAWGSDLVRSILALKPHQSYGSTKKLKESLSALALEQFMRQVNLNLGGK